LQKVGVSHERLWSYHEGDKAVEGIPESKLKELIATGQIKRSVLVRSPGMAYWVKASDIKTLLPDFVQTPHPTTRFFARISDLFIYSFIVYFIIGFLSVFIPGLEFVGSGQLVISILLSIIIICTWSVPESFFISAFGTTPGKWICNTWVSDASGNKLTLGVSFSRSIRVMIEGIAIGIPIVYLLTAIRSYDILVKTGQTSWDHEGHITISHGKIGPFRIIAMFVLVCLYMLDRYASMLTS
jgi:uncharacterized RDD family membrane protein YckC